MIYFSEKEQGIYHTDFSEYILPNDAIKITYDQFLWIFEERSKGYTVRFAVDGLISNLEETKNQKKNKEILWAESELEYASKQLEKVQDGDSDSFGTVSSWRNYRKNLRKYINDISEDKSSERPILDN